MSFKKYFIATKEEIASDIEERVKTKEDISKYLNRGFKGYLIETLIIAAAYAFRNELDFPLDWITTGLGAIVAADFAQRIGFGIPEIWKDLGRETQDKPESYQNIAKAMCPPGLVGRVREYLKKK